MAVNIDIDVAVDDSKFSQFAAAFKKYNDELSKTPQAWANAASATGKMRAAAAGTEASLRKQAASMADVAKHTTTLHQLTTSTSRMWHDMSRSTRDVAGHIKTRRTRSGANSAGRSVVCA